MSYLSVIAASRRTTTVSNLYDLANAANPIEVNATTGFGDLLRASITSVSSSPSPQDGTWSILMEHTGGTNEQCWTKATLNLENGSTYQIEVYIQEVVGLNWQWGLLSGDGWTASNTSTVSAVSTWTKFTKTGTTNSTNPKLFFGGTTSADGGNKLGIDNIVITKL